MPRMRNSKPAHHRYLPRLGRSPLATNRITVAETVATEIAICLTDRRAGEVNENRISSQMESRVERPIRSPVGSLIRSPMRSLVRSLLSLVRDRVRSLLRELVRCLVKGAIKMLIKGDYRSRSLIDLNLLQPTLVDRFRQLARHCFPHHYRHFSSPHPRRPLLPRARPLASDHLNPLKCH